MGLNVENYQNQILPPVLKEKAPPKAYREEPTYVGFVNRGRYLVLSNCRPSFMDR